MGKAQNQTYISISERKGLGLPWETYRFVWMSPSLVLGRGLRSSEGPKQRLSQLGGRHGKGCGCGGMRPAERTANAEALRREGERRRGTIQCGRDSGHRVGGDAGEAPEASLVLQAV